MSIKTQQPSDNTATPENQGLTNPISNPTPNSTETKITGDVAEKDEQKKDVPAKEPKVDIGEAFKHVKTTLPQHIITVIGQEDGAEVFIIHKSTPPNLYEATHIYDTLRKEHVVGLHLYLKGTEEELISQLLAIH